jgi:hypothetical protein
MTSTVEVIALRIMRFGPQPWFGCAATGALLPDVARRSAEGMITKDVPQCSKGYIA